MLTLETVFEHAPDAIFSEMLASGLLPTEVYPGEGEDIYVFGATAAVHVRNEAEDRVIWAPWDGAAVHLSQATDTDTLLFLLGVN